MRIAFVTYEFPPRLVGGAGVYAKNVASNLAGLGHDVTVFVPTVGGEARSERSPEGVEIERIPRPREGLRLLLPFGLKALKSIEGRKGGDRFDVVHLNGLGFVGLRDRGNSSVYVSTGHHLSVETAAKAGLSLAGRLKDFQGENGHIVPLMERYGARLADRFLAVSRETKEDLQRVLGIPAPSIDVVWNGVDGSGAPSGPRDREELRRWLGLPEGPLVLFVGRVDDPRKELLSLVRAVAGLPHRLDAKLVAVGGGSPSKPLELAERLGIKDRLAFPGRLSSEALWSAYLAADLHVCASRQEGFGLTILEAICAGCPVISTKVGVAPEIEDRLADMVPTGSHEALRDAISAFLRERRERPRQGEVAIPHELSWERCAEQTLASYEGAIRLRTEGSKRRRP
jgi:glycosyltransferase involved in cell wall biosynthesis